MLLTLLSFDVCWISFILCRALIPVGISLRSKSSVIFSFPVIKVREKWEEERNPAI